MWLILLFRICLLGGILFVVWKWGDWKNRGRYYPTVLFIMTVNLAVCLITYHHTLWNYHPDALVKTQTTIELLNSFVMLPSTAFAFLSRFPYSSDAFYQYGYILLWALVFSTLEFIDKTIGGIYYEKGWSWEISTLFDCAIFLILRLHYVSPFWAWLITFVRTAVILVVFNFSSAEFK
ncbi:CBO0543 family protein [Sporomusa sp.]|uniref:CBO0543 family protein n=1 Tax=Sporomusa sp. TaxID=2078658 RepID=UPI002C997B1B|nr:CBO0543 family protein [Sporomusa sp.]HWR42258.1 CBO0543 family protein [Sporomusa sp.]